MNFWFKRKKIIIDCFTTNVTAHDVFPMAPSKEFIPKWFKDMPAFTEPEADALTKTRNMKGCTGFRDLYDTGWIIPLWSDVIVNVSDNRTPNRHLNFQFADARSELKFHGPEQRGTYMPIYKYTHMKITSPWKIRCNKYVKFMYTGVPYNFEGGSALLYLNGIMDFKYQHGTHANFFVEHRDQEQQFIINAGQPIAQIIPLTEDEIEFKTHLILESEVDKYVPSYRHQGSFFFGYQKLIKKLEGKK